MDILSFLLSLFVGFEVGLKLKILIQLLIFLGAMFYLRSGYVRRKELGGIYDLWIVVIFSFGIFIGNMIYIVMRPESINKAGTYIKFLFTP